MATGNSMKKIFVELIEDCFEHDQACPKNHVPNAATRKALEHVQTRKGLQKASTVEELLKKLSQ